MIPVLICGSRSFDHAALIPYEMGRHILPIWDQVEIVHGDCLDGADAKADAIFRAYGLPVNRFPADWNKFGRSAGFKRNKSMAVYLQTYKKRFGFAFWDGVSPGTKNMIATAEDMGIKMHVVYYLERKFYFNQLLQEWQDKFKHRAGKNYISCR